MTDKEKYSVYVLNEDGVTILNQDLNATAAQAWWVHYLVRDPVCGILRQSDGKEMTWGEDT